MLIRMLLCNRCGPPRTLSATTMVPPWAWIR
jgi:hypothetical protein